MARQQAPDSAAAPAAGVTTSADGTASADGTTSADETIPSLSWTSFSLCLAIVLGIFLGLNPLWKPLDMDRMDDNILWSYVPIPLLVLLALGFERKLRWSSWLLETTRLTLVKLGVTFVAMNTVWSFMGLPESGPGEAAPQLATGEVVDRFSLIEAPPATTLQPGTTGRLAGRVLDASGVTVSGALVSIVGGLRRIRFAPPTGTVVIEHDGRGFVPDFAIVHTHQPVLLRATDDVLHTAFAQGLDGKLLFNYPALPRNGRALMFRRAAGVVDLACKVHDDERSTRLAIVSNPFASRTDDAGRFGWDGVPAGELDLSVWLPGQPLTSAVATVTAGEATSLDITLR